jgi:glycosyltransferase involved in cell wall biosynthesis
MGAWRPHVGVVLHHRGYRDGDGNLFVKDVWGGFLDELADRLGARFTLYTSRDRRPRERFQHFAVAGSRHLTLKCPPQPPPGVALAPFLADLPRLDAVLVFLPTLRGLVAAAACRASHVPFFVYSGTGGNAYAGTQRGVAVRARWYERLESPAIRGARGAIVAGAELEARFRARMPTYRTAPITGVTAPGAVGEKRREVLYVGSLGAHKGVPELLAAWDHIHADQRGDWQLRLVGSGPLEQDARRYARGRGDCEVLGYVPHGPQLYAAYARAAIFVLPSHNEGFPRVLLEAAAHRCALVATPVGGVPAAFVDGYEPEWVTAGDPRSLAAGLERMMRGAWTAAGADAFGWFEATFGGRDRAREIADFMRTRAPELVEEDEGRPAPQGPRHVMR